MFFFTALCQQNWLGTFPTNSSAMGSLKLSTGRHPRHDNGRTSLDPWSEDVQHAIEQALEDAQKHGCIRPCVERDGGEPEAPSTDGETKRIGTNAKEHKRTRTKRRNNNGRHPPSKGEHFHYSLFPTCVLALYTRLDGPVPER